MTTKPTKETDKELVYYNNIKYFCAKCGYPEEAHYNRGISYPAKADILGKYHFVVCKKFKSREL